jgi:hypothetical protein
MPIPCNSILEVLRELDTIIEDCTRQNDPRAIFAYVYRRTTAQIKIGILNHAFENPGRMEQMDVTFANRYLIAYQDYKEGKPVSSCWKTAFDPSQGPLSIIQHIMLGMNAHINLDLGVAAADVMKGKPILELEYDFNKVNVILASLVDEMQSGLGKVSSLMFLLDWVGGRTDEKIIDFSMQKAREQSWKTATGVWSVEGQQRLDKIMETDILVTILAERLKNPRTRMLQWVLKWIRVFEEKQIDKIIKGLQS